MHRRLHTRGRRRTTLAGGLLHLAWRVARPSPSSVAIVTTSYLRWVETATVVDDGEDHGARPAGEGDVHPAPVNPSAGGDSADLALGGPRLRVTERGH
jgi:hypothetical protein